VDPEWSNPEQLRVAPGATFAVVSGLGGRSIRPQARCLPARPPYGCEGEWAAIYSSDQEAKYGALFLEFHVNGDPNAARGYFKNIDGKIIDQFTITAGARVLADVVRPPVEERPAPAGRRSAAAREARPRSPSPPSDRRPSSSSDGCVVSRDRWQGTAFASQRGTFSVAFDMIPERSPINAIAGLSLGRADDYDDLAASVRFSPDGVIDARDGSRFSAQTPIPYEPGARYRVRMVVRVPDRAYDVYVTPPDGPERTLALGHAFRSEQEDVKALNHWAVFARDGSHRVCAFSGP